uniref:RAD54 homolog B n=1 Tax=Ailuropoda melanoleuca TaxID=9646 RepID=A0A7N5K673_AILME
MRRSAAPSQLQGNPFKKLKFIPPGRSNPSPNEENTKMSPDVKLFEVVASKNTFLQLQNNPRICSLNLPTEGNAREVNHGHNYSGRHCSKASVMATLDPPHTVQTWMRKHRLVRVHYR